MDVTVICSAQKNHTYFSHHMNIKKLKFTHFLKHANNYHHVMRYKVKNDKKGKHTSTICNNVTNVVKAMCSAYGLKHLCIALHHYIVCFASLNVHQFMLWTCIITNTILLVLPNGYYTSMENAFDK